MLAEYVWGVAGLVTATRRKNRVEKGNCGCKATESDGGTPGQV